MNHRSRRQGGFLFRLVQVGKEDVLVVQVTEAQQIHGHFHGIGKLPLKRVLQHHGNAIRL